MLWGWCRLVADDRCAAAGRSLGRGLGGVAEAVVELLMDGDGRLAVADAVRAGEEFQDDIVDLDEAVLERIPTPRGVRLFPWPVGNAQR